MLWMISKMPLANFGICAVAQEGRQIDALVPINRRTMDYVTFQSYFDYINDIRKIRADQNGNLNDHFMALSKLSRMMVKTLLFVTIFLLIFSIAIAPEGFQWTNMLVVSYKSSVLYCITLHCIYSYLYIDSLFTMIYTHTQYLHQKSLLPPLFKHSLYFILFIGTGTVLTYPLMLS